MLQLLDTLKRLKEYKEVKVPIYNFVTHRREERMVPMYGANVIIFEGIFAFHDKQVVCLLDMKVKINHSALIRNLIKLKGTAKLIAQGEWVCLKDSNCILFEILANRTWKALSSSCGPSQPHCQIGLVRLAGACTALPCPICIFGILFTLCN